MERNGTPDNFFPEDKKMKNKDFMNHGTGKPHILCEFSSFQVEKMHHEHEI